MAIADDDVVCAVAVAVADAADADAHRKNWLGQSLIRIDCSKDLYAQRISTAAKIIIRQD